MLHRTVSILVVGGVALLGACSGDDTTSEPADSTTTSSVVSALADDDPIVYVVMGDSIAFTPSMPDGFMWRYADMIEQQFGVDVELRNWAKGSIHSATMLDQLRNDAGLRADLAEADVVTTDIPINVWVESLKTVNAVGGRDPAACGGDDGQACLQEALEAYEADADAIIDELVAICRDDVVIRLYDVYLINTGPQVDNGTFDVVNSYWKPGMDYVETSAARYGIPVAQVYDAFMGPDGTDDPFVEGLLDTDQMHPNVAGAELIAELVDGFGY